MMRSRGRKLRSTGHFPIAERFYAVLRFLRLSGCCAVRLRSARFQIPREERRMSKSGFLTIMLALSVSLPGYAQGP